MDRFLKALGAAVILFAGVTSVTFFIFWLKSVSFALAGVFLFVTSVAAFYLILDERK